MGFFDLFRPRYRHSDPKIRAEAVRDLDADQMAVIEQILKEETDAQVRRVAWKKIDDPERIEEMAQGEQDQALKRQVLERAAEKWQQLALSEDETQAERALSHVTETRGLVELVKRSPLEHIVDRALAGLSDERALRDVAISDERKRVALAAIARLQSAEHLEAVAKNGKTKAIRAAAEAKLPKKAAGASSQAKTVEAKKPVEVSAEKKNRARQVQLCRQLEELAAQTDLERAKREADAARSEWLQLSWVSQDAELDKRFERACGLIDRMGQAPAPAPQKEAAPDVVEATAPAPAPVAQAPVVDEETQRLRDERKRVAEARAAQKEEEKKRRDEEVANAKARLDDTAQGLEGALEDVALTFKRALEALDTAKAALGSDEMKRLPQEAKARLVAVRDKLGVKIAELREADNWKRWANVPLLEKLVARAEELSKTPEAPDAQKALRALMDEWKTIGSAPKSKHDALWERFRAALDVLGVKEKAERAAKKEEMVANLAKREELIAKAEAIVASTDVKDAAEQMKALQAEWKTIGPVRRAESDATWKRFRAACDQVFERRKAEFEKNDAERAVNLKKREELINKAEAVAGSTKWREATEELKTLQATWKELGPVPREHADATWTRFREACDKFFARKKEHFGALDAEKAKERENEATPDDLAAARRSAEEFKDNKLPLGDLASKLGMTPKE